MQVMVFACSDLAIPTIEWLRQSNMLAGVAVSVHPTPRFQRLEHYLIQNQVPGLRYSPENINEVIDAIQQSKATLGLVATFDHKLPQEVIAAFPDNKLFNMHASALPKWRGPSPLFWQVKSGQKQLTITVHQIDRHLDNGPVLVQATFDIDPRHTLGVVANNVASRLPSLAKSTIEIVQTPDWQAQLTLQHGESCPAPKPTHEDIIIDWSRLTSQEIIDLCRACNPDSVGAIIYVKQTPVFVISARTSNAPKYGLSPGKVLQVSATDNLLIATKDGALHLDVLSTGDGVLTGYDFANLYNIDAGEALNKNG